MNDLTVGIRVEENYYSLPPERIFALAARNNVKRSYLFVSKLIGKHIPVRPQVPFITGFLLASRLAQSLGLAINKDKVDEGIENLVSDSKNPFQHNYYLLQSQALFIGFAETATALGHSVFNCFQGDINYLHTTRENLEGDQDTIYFTEDHSHAPDQRCLINKVDLFNDNDLLVLIDDEITTGNTCLNIIKTLQAKYPQKKYVVLTILDWRSESAQKNFYQVEQELGVPIEVLSLLKGSFGSEGNSTVDNKLSAAVMGPAPKVNILRHDMGFYTSAIGQDGKTYTYLGYTGRFGLNEMQNKYLQIKADKFGARLLDLRKGKKTLCLGTGEFMYIPVLISRSMGDDVFVQSTTLSPVHPYQGEDYAINYAITFHDPSRPGISNFIYNIPPDCYDEVFIFWERKVLPEQVDPLVQSIYCSGVKNITFVYFCN